MSLPDPPLPPQYQWAPTNPLPKSYRPLGMFYKVRTGDSFASLAKRSGLSAKFLLEYNFKTTDPREVNWYLFTRIGCKKWSPDGKSWSFTNEAEPGLIYFPSNHYPRGDEAPLNLTRLHHKVFPPVPPKQAMYPQATCWAASALMMLSWRLGTSVGSQVFPDLYRKRVAEGRPLSPDRLPAFFRSLSPPLRELKKIPTPDEWPIELRTHGPILVVLMATARADHIVVVVEAMFDNSTVSEPVATVAFIDPGDKRTHEAESSKFNEWIEHSPTVHKLWYVGRR